MNPLLDFSGLPRFADINVEHVTPAVDTLLAECKAVIERVESDATPATWRDFIEPLENANERLSRAWGQVGHLNAVMNSPELREVYNGNLPKLTAYFTELGQNEKLFNKNKWLRNSPEFATLTVAQQKIIDNELRDFRLGGAELPADKKARFKAISEELSKLSSQFSDNVLDATNAFAHFVDDEKGLSGLPDDVKQAAREAAEKDSKAGWKFTLHAPSYLPVMQYADDRQFRELMYRASATRASEFGDARLDNTPLIAQIVRLRKELAGLLDFANYAAYSLEPKMAETPKQVIDFLNELAARAKPYAERDLQELKDFARSELGMNQLEAWDYAYVSEKLRVSRYAFSEQEVKQYLPETTVVPGMFKLIETLYGLTIAPAEAPTWHPDVRFYAIRDKAGKLIGEFYLDLYARGTKRGGAWMDDAITRRRLASGVQVPVAYLNCNFSAPVGGQPALFTHDEVITLYHEFGHGLHHLLTEVDYLGVSGIHGVEWDAVELPSQFMENFCWEWDVLRPMTRHAQTGKPLPKTLFDKMLAAKNFQSGMQMVRQIEFSLFDLELHSSFDPNGTSTALDLIHDVRRRVAVVFPPDYNRFANSFTHIFSGGYAAGYYSYKWAEVLSADAFSLFEEQGVLDPAVGQRFRSEILAMGGSRPAMDSFKAFRGREPEIDALLRHNGMVAA
ncbi:MAG: M3 family metallopeptidase [Betaproteobacteria bacterium]|nr:M3 family metallopeptidase [Betaproteobacteria bacterium]